MSPPPSRSLAQAHTTRRSMGAPAVILIALMVGALLIASLWVSFSAIMEKTRLSHGLHQIIDIVTLVREAAGSDTHIGESDHEDLLGDLQRTRGYIATGKMNGLNTLTNPWNGPLIAIMDKPHLMMRVETSVPAHICRRILDMFGDDPQSFGVQRIEVQQQAQSWQPVYSGPGNPQASDGEVAYACGLNGSPALAMLFELR